MGIFTKQIQATRILGWEHGVSWPINSTILMLNYTMTYAAIPLYMYIQFSYSCSMLFYFPYTSFFIPVRYCLQVLSRFDFQVFASTCSQFTQTRQVPIETKVFYPINFGTFLFFEWYLEGRGMSHNGNRMMNQYMFTRSVYFNIFQ